MGNDEPFPSSYDASLLSGEDDEEDIIDQDADYGDDAYEDDDEEDDDYEDEEDLSIQGHIDRGDEFGRDVVLDNIEPTWELRGTSNSVDERVVVHTSILTRERSRWDSNLGRWANDRVSLTVNCEHTLGHQCDRGCAMDTALSMINSYQLTYDDFPLDEVEDHWDTYFYSREQFFDARRLFGEAHRFFSVDGVSFREFLSLLDV